MVQTARDVAMRAGLLVCDMEPEQSMLEGRLPGTSSSETSRDREHDADREGLIPS